MSDLTPTPLPKKSLFKRLLRIALWSLLTIIVLLALTLGFFHLPVGRGIIRDAIADGIGKRFEGHVTLGDFDWALFSDIHLRDLVIATPDGTPVVAVKAVDVALDWGSLLGTPTITQVVVDGVKVDLEAFADGTNTLMRMAKPQPTQLVDAIVEQFELRRLDVRIRMPDDASVTLSDGQASASLVLALLSEGGLTLDLKAFSAQITTIAPRTASGVRAAEEVTDTARWAGGTRASFGVETTGRVAVAWGAPFTQGPDGPIPPGRMPTRLEARFEPKATPLVVESPDPRLAAAEMRLPLQLPTLGARLVDGALELRLGAYQVGPMTAQGVVATAKPGQAFATATTVADALKGLEVALNVTGVRMVAADLNRLGAPAAAATGETPPLVLADLEANLSGGGPLNAVVLKGDARWGEARLDLAVEADVSNALLPVWMLTLKGHDIAPKTLLALPQAPDVAANFELVLNGRGLFPPDADIRTRLDVGGLAVEGQEVETLSLAAGVVGERITLQSFDVEVFGQKLTVTGEADRITRSFKAVAESRLDLARALDKTPLADLLPAPLPRAEGSLTLDLRVEGTLSPDALAALEEGVRTRQPPLLAGMPFERVALGGKVRIDDFRFNHITLKSLAFDLDLKGEGGLPTGPLGITLRDLKADIDGRTVVIDSVDLNADIAGTEGRFRLAATASSERMTATVGGLLAFDPEAMNGRLTIDTLELVRGGLAVGLARPVRITADRQGARLEDLALTIAGGEILATGQATVEPAEGERPATLKHFDLKGSARGLDTTRLAAALGPAGAGLRGLPARIDARFQLGGTPASPVGELALDVRTRARGPLPALAATLTTSIDADGVRGRLGLKPAGIKGDAWLDGIFALPMIWPTEPGAMARIAPDRPLRLELSLREGRIARWLGETDADALGTAALSLLLEGSPARPRGHWSFSWTLPLENLPSLRLEAAGTVAPANGGRVAFDGTTDILSETTPITRAQWTGDVARSPLILPPGAPLPAWTVRGDVTQQLTPLAPYLARILPPALANVVITGDANATFEASGRGPDLFADLRHTLRIRALDGIPALTAWTGLFPLELAGSLRLDDTRLALTHRTAVGAEAHAVQNLELALGLGGKGLLRALPRLLRTPDGLRAITVDGAFSVPTRAPTAWLDLLGAPPAFRHSLGDAGGLVGGTIDIAGHLLAPEITGHLGWRDFRAVSGNLASLEIVLDQQVGTHILGLFWGSRDIPAAPGNGPKNVQLHLFVPPVANLMSPKTPPLFAVRGFGKGAQLIDLIPALPALAGLPPIRGTIGTDLTADLALERSPTTAPHAGPSIRLLHLAGGFTLDDLGFPIPDSTRVLERGRLAVAFAPRRIDLTTFEIHERDAHRDTRWLRASGHVDLQQLRPTTAALRVEALDFLVGGLAPDGPEGELDLDLAIDATELAGAKPHIALIFNHLDFDAPDRFIRAHHPQILSHGDIFDPARMGDAYPAPGRLPVPKPLLPPLPRDLAVGLAIVFPKPGRLGAHPLDIDVVGRLDASLADGALDLRGRLDVVRGTLDAMGWLLDFQKGAIEAHGHPDTAKMELTFGIAPNQLALRDTTIDGWHDGKAFITARATLAKGLETIFSGVGGPNVLDMATFVNTGRTRLWNAPDVPASGTVRFGNLDQGLVNTFIATNLRNFIFMDRALAFSDALVDHERYGRLEWFDMQRYVPDADQRISLRSRPLSMGTNQLELGWDWLLVDRPRGSLGLGPRLGIDARLGLGFFWQWSSPD
jgi:hypothetical protein